MRSTRWLIRAALLGVLATPLGDARAQFVPPDEPSGCKKCGDYVLVTPHQTITISPACIPAAFGSGGYAHCQVESHGCRLSALCQVV